MPAGPPSLTKRDYRAVFEALKLALRASHRADGSVAVLEARGRLERALGAAETMIRTHQLKTRQQAFALGALRPDTVYLDSADLSRVEEARRLLGEG